MNRYAPRRPACLFALTVLLACAPAAADKPDWAGGGNGGNHKEKKHTERGEDRQRASIEIRFGDDHRHLINDYYGSEFRRGNCPPGLAKKNNGCQPPGQAKKWNKGRPLPHDLQYYDLPRELVIRLPQPPSGQRYVRIASDILLIAVGTGMVIDAIEDIGRQ
jgi:Ni/Co efflux regulator RcnB